MHLFLMTRGARHLRETWMAFMQSQMFPFGQEKLDKDGKKTGEIVKGNAQGVLRPIELWEYIFPEEHLDLVVNNITDVAEDGSISHGDFNSLKGRWMLKPLRMALGAKKLPKIKIDPRRIIPKDILSSFNGNIIGYRKDERKGYTFKQIESSYDQEGL